MNIASPIVFEPLYMERVWGGRTLASLFGRRLPPAVPIGESWEIVDREDAQSVVHEGPLKGRTLHELWTELRAPIFGDRDFGGAPRFPMLFKLLDARDRLSVQVHPPAAVAAQLGGEPKTEMWYFLHCEPDARIYAGLRRGVTCARFQSALEAGTVEETLHSVLVRTGDSIFIPSGRLHAIGEGNVIVEVQQNSDTTYRVFDWNRPGLDGKPRTLHIEQSMLSIDFEDFEPPADRIPMGPLADSPFFRVEKLLLTGPMEAVPAGEFAVITCLEGDIRCGARTFRPGDFFLVPASAADRTLVPAGPRAAVLRSMVP